MADNVDGPAGLMLKHEGAKTARAAKARAVAARKAAEAAEAAAVAAEAEAEAEEAEAEEAEAHTTDGEATAAPPAVAVPEALKELDETDEPTNATTSTGALPPLPTDNKHGKHPRNRLFPASVVAMIVLALALAGATIYLTLDHRSVLAQQDRDNAIIESAKRNVSDLIAPTYQDAAGSAQRILDNATGDWESQFTPNADAFAQALIQAKVESTADVSDVAIERHNDDGTTDLLVAATSQVRNTAAAEPSTRTWRLRLTVTDVNGQYKLSKVEQIV
jgi:Mce-associated membrane protein